MLPEQVDMAELEREEQRLEQEVRLLTRIRVFQQETLEKIDGLVIC